MERQSHRRLRRIKQGTGFYQMMDVLDFYSITFALKLNSWIIEFG